MKLSLPSIGKRIVKERTGCNVYSGVIKLIKFNITWGQVDICLGSGINMWGENLYDKYLRGMVIR